MHGYENETFFIFEATGFDPEKKKHERKVVARIFAFSMYAQKSTFSDAPSYS